MPESFHRSAFATADCVAGSVNGDIKRVVCLLRFTGSSPHSSKTSSNPCLAQTGDVWACYQTQDSHGSIPVALSQLTCFFRIPIQNEIKVLAIQISWGTCVCQCSGTPPQETHVRQRSVIFLAQEHFRSMSLGELCCDFERSRLQVPLRVPQPSSCVARPLSSHH